MSRNKKLLEYIIFRRILRKRRRTIYIRDIFKNRNNYGETQLMRELEFDEEYHKKYIRMSKENFEVLLQKVEKNISHPPNHSRPISAKTRLVLTLRYLATGASHVTLGFCFRISTPQISTILWETLSAIWSNLKDEYLPQPTAETWLENTAKFSARWQFVNCCGAIDGKHVQIKNFHHSGSENHNYKKYFSIVLLACVNPEYMFTVVDIGAQGSESDSGILEKSEFGTQLYNNTLPLPPPTVIESQGETFSLPPVFLGDQGFQLRINLMTPYSLRPLITEDEKIFNLRLSRARRIVENAFGILAARWRVFHTPIDAQEDLVRLTVQASVVLHNFLTSKSDKCIIITADKEDELGNIEEGSWRGQTMNDNGLVSSGRSGSNNYGRAARIVRDNFKKYFCTEGSVPWQTAYVRRGLRASQQQLPPPPPQQQQQLPPPPPQQQQQPMTRHHHHHNTRSKCLKTAPVKSTLS